VSNGPPVGRCQATHEQSQQLLHQFLQWESKNQHNRNISIVDRQILSKDVRFGAHHGLNSDIAPGPLCATGRLMHRSKQLHSITLLARLSSEIARVRWRSHVEN
jgi:hypothetical protein